RGITDDAVGGRLHRGRRATGRTGGETQAILNPEATIYSAKRFIGRKWDEVETEIETVPYKVVKGPSDAVRFEVRGKQFAPEEIAAAVLRSWPTTRPNSSAKKAP